MDGNGNGQPLTKAEFLEAMGQLRSYIDGGLQSLHERLQSLKEYVDKRTHDAETRLLRGFADFASTYEIRMRKMNADSGNLNTATDTRLAIVEDRLAAVERKLLAKGM
jgi:hypothetical protein